MICDYPTGGFADKYGRLKIFMIGMIFMGTSIFMMVSGNGFLLYLGAIILGIGESQVSGTLFPWFVHTLNEKGVSEEERKESILKVNAQSQYITNFLGILISLCSCKRVQLSLILCLSNQFRYRTKILI